MNNIAALNPKAKLTDKVIDKALTQNGQTIKLLSHCNFELVQ
jgi:hypothetical protein